MEKAKRDENHLSGDELLELVEGEPGDNPDLEHRANLHMNGCAACLVAYTRLGAAATGLDEADDRSGTSPASLPPGQRTGRQPAAVAMRRSGVPSSPIFGSDSGRTVATLFDGDVKIRVARESGNPGIAVGAADMERLGSVVGNGVSEVSRSAVYWRGLIATTTYPILLRVEYDGRVQYALLEDPESSG